MYSRYSMPLNSNNMYRNNRNINYQNMNDERFFGGGLVGPLILGGLAGYALGRPNQCCQGGFFYPPQPYVPYYPNNYYNYYY